MVGGQRRGRGSSNRTSGGRYTFVFKKANNDILGGRVRENRTKVLHDQGGAIQAAGGWEQDEGVQETGRGKDWDPYVLRPKS